MLKWFKSWKAHYWPSESDMYDRGKTYAQNLLACTEPHKAEGMLRFNGIDRTRAFDRGVDDVLQQMHRTIDAGYACALTILTTAPYKVAVDVIHKKAEDPSYGPDYFGRGMLKALEEWKP